MKSGNNLWTSCLALALFAATGAFAQETVCADFEGSSRVIRFGSNSVASERSDTLEDLRRLSEQHRSELEAVMRDRGVGHLADQIFEAIASGDGVTERSLEQGETLDWMASRQEDGVTSGGPVCIATSTTYDAFVIKIVEVEEDPAMAQCSLDVSSDCDAGTITVDALGSSSGVEVSQSGGASNVFQGSSTMATLDFVDRYHEGYSFTATATAGGSRRTTTHTFVIPKICLNLSYSGPPVVEEEALTDSCTETASVDLCHADDPACTIEISPQPVRSRQDVQVSVSGHWDAANPDALSVSATDPGGEPLTELTSFPATVNLPHPGTYSFSGTAVNEAGESSQCSASIEVDPRFTFRGFNLGLFPNTDRLAQNGPVAAPFAGDISGSDELFQYELSSGFGLGGDFEWHFNPRIGWNTSLLWTMTDSAFRYDSTTAWESDDDSLSSLSLTTGPNFHLTPTRPRADFYLGLFVGIADLGSGSYDIPSAVGGIEVDLGSGFTYGALLGFDYALGARRAWALHAGTRIFLFDADEGARRIDGNPWNVELGFARRF